MIGRRGRSNNEKLRFFNHPYFLVFMVPAKRRIVSFRAHSALANVHFLYRSKFLPEPTLASILEGAAAIEI